jgi:hypothetical protein
MPPCVPSEEQRETTSTNKHADCKRAHLQGRPGAEREACAQRGHHFGLRKACDFRVHRRRGHQFQTRGALSSRALRRGTASGRQVSSRAQELREPERGGASRLQGGQER